MIRYRSLLHFLSLLIVFLSVGFLVPIVVAFIYRDGSQIALILSFISTLSFGGILWFFTRGEIDLRLREGFAVVSLGWLACAIFGALPFYFSGVANITDSFFESMSGFTTTGASIFTSPSQLPEGILFWRSFTHWVGGMGIIVFSIAIMPLMGTGGISLMKAEMPGPTVDKIKPRIQEAAKSYWKVYVLISAVETILLKIGGMNWFDSLCHTFGTMATGGFSTKDSSIGFYNDQPFIQYVIIFFMIAAGVNFALHYRFLKRDWKVYFQDREMHFFLSVILIVTLILFWQNRELFPTVEMAIRHVLFQVVALLTTTGYGTFDYELWTWLSRILLFLLMFFGGMGGSTGGGLKNIRIMTLLKYGAREVRCLYHPTAVILVRIGKQTIPMKTLQNTVGFFLQFMAVYIAVVIAMAAVGMNFETALSSATACLCNIGPGLGDVGPTENYAWIPDTGKWILSFAMMFGRLEILTVIVLLTKRFWKEN